jgi:phosphoribosylformimino-5-aminoimidazole carboxamide ribotide isomerase
MIVFPAIDILGGRAVRLRQGDYEQVTVYNDDPVAQARIFAEQGAEWIHVVDLDGARDGVPGNIDVIGRIAAEVGLPIQTGGGIRSLETLARHRDAGVARMVLGTKLATDATFVRSAVAEFGDAIVAGVDARDGEVQIAGWREGTRRRASELVEELRDLGVRHLVYTDISRDGMRTGVNVDAYEEISETADFPVIASGGISTLDDFRELAALGPDTVEGAVTGRALYEGAFKLKHAIRAARGEY